MKLQRIVAITQARNIEFLRDRSALGWNLLLPVLLVLGLATIFSGDGQSLYKVGVLAESVEAALPAPDREPLMGLAFTDFVPQPDGDRARRVTRWSRCWRGWPGVPLHAPWSPVNKPATSTG